MQVRPSIEGGQVKFGFVYPSVRAHDQIRFTPERLAEMQLQLALSGRAQVDIGAQLVHIERAEFNDELVLAVGEKSTGQVRHVYLSEDTGESLIAWIARNRPQLQPSTRPTHLAIPLSETASDLAVSSRSPYSRDGVLEGEWLELGDGPVSRVAFIDPDEDYRGVLFVETPEQGRVRVDDVPETEFIDIAEGRSPDWLAERVLPDHAVQIPEPSSVLPHTWQDVTSQMIKRLAFKPYASGGAGELYVEFQRSGNGGTSRYYRYDGVPEQDYRTLGAADSVGRSFHQLIRSRYPFERLTPAS